VEGCMEFLVPLMPLFATLPIAVAGAWIVHRILRHKERSAGSRAQLEELQQEFEALRSAHMELQERLDFTERMLGQVRDAQRTLK
jgi:hypothetical protein